MNTTTTTRGVSEAMVAELIAAGDFLAMNGTDGMVRRWEKAKAALSAPEPAAQGEDNEASIHAIQFALTGEDGMAFLRCWNEGNFDACRREWPEAPEACYVGADPLTAPPAQPAERVADEAVASFVERAGAIIGGAPFPSGPSLAKAREICDLALTMLTASPAPAERVPELANTLVNTIDNECELVMSSKVWEAKEALQQALASPAPSEGGKGVDGVRKLAKYQPCGCVICTCEDEVQCHGCGAHHCGSHPVAEFDNPAYTTGAAR